MLVLFSALADPNTLHGLTASVFALAFLSTLSVSFFSKDASGYRKFCGALAILLLALKVNDPWLYWFAVLIGGTVVASEDFMVKIASLQKSDKDNLAEVVAAILRTDKQVKEPVQQAETQNLPTSIPSIGGPDSPHKE